MKHEVWSPQAATRPQGNSRHEASSSFEGPSGCHTPTGDDHHTERLPQLPPDVQRNILARLAASWADRPVRLAKEEVREWAQYNLVCREWRDAFHKQPLCVVFEEAPSRAQMEWLRCSRSPIRRITFLPSWTPCRTTLSTVPAQLAQRSAGDSIQLRRNPLERMDSWPHGRMQLGTVA